MIKLKIMALLNRNCNNCKWCEGVLCKVPIKVFNAFEGVIFTTKDYLYCVDNVGRTNCKWKKKMIRGTLTADDVRKSIESRFEFDVWVPKERWQVIADELNTIIDNPINETTGKPFDFNNLAKRLNERGKADD